VPHAWLLQKLESVEHILNGLKTFLETELSVHLLLSLVYHRGHLMFLLFINDLSSNIESVLKLYADYVLIYRSINGPIGHQTIIV